MAVLFCQPQAVLCLARGKLNEAERGLSYRPGARKPADALASAKLVGIALDSLEIRPLPSRDQPHVAVATACINEKYVAGLDLVGVSNGDVVGNTPKPRPACLLPHVVDAGGARYG